MYIVKYSDGFYCETVNKGSNDSELVRGAILKAECMGKPYRGTPLDFAKDALRHLSDTFFPIIRESYGGCDSHGNYTTEVIFQAV